MKEFTNEKDFENWIQEQEDFPDNVKIGDIIFTMDNYDLEGKEITYGNKRTFKGFTVKNSDRYKEGIKDSIVEDIEITCIRNDIVYLD